MVSLPSITLDTTLADLYRKSSPKNAHKRIGQVLCGVNSGMSLSDDFPRNRKYLYQDTPFSNLTKKELHDDNEELQRSLAKKYLSLVPQRDAFVCGDTVNVFFNVDQSPEQIEHDRQEAERTINVLDPKQRPKLVFCPGPGKIPLKENGIDMLTCKVVLDQLEAYPPVVELDQHWYCNSKEALARSGLPTPDCKIIEVTGHSAKASECCEVCRSGDALYIAPECTSNRSVWLKEQMDRVLGSLKSHPLPFVLKNQQTYGGAGTCLVRSEQERSKLVKDLSSDLLRRLFSQITPENEHLRPGTVLLSDLVKDPVGDYGLTFFVTDSGEAIFLGVSEQMTDANSAWIGSTINYTHQARLEGKFSPIMRQIAGWLHEHGYYGPAGADILETQSKPVDGEPKRTDLHIVDLNVRTSGSICLPLLRSHFEKRGMVCASSFSVTVKKTREEFIKEWESEFESGRMCILSWYEDKEEGVSIADVAVGSEDEEKLQGVMNKVRESSDEVTF